MEAPPIKYVTTKDGVGIAWAEVGEGPAMLFCAQTPFSHVQEQFTVFSDSWEAFARSFRFVTFDARGTGMSQRDVASVSIETLLLDAEAVLDAASLDRVVVNADGASILATYLSVRLAIEFPKRVTHLVLESPIENTGQLSDTPFGRTNLALAELDWHVYIQTLFRVLLGLSSAEMVSSSAEAAARWVDPAIGVQYIREGEAVDLRELLPMVKQPALVTRNEGFFVPARVAQGVAAKIPGAQFRHYADPTYARMADLIASFMGLRTGPASPGPAPHLPGTATHTGLTAQTGLTSETGLTVILFVDIVDSTALTERLGDAAFREKARDLDSALRAIIREHSGTPIEGKLLGDGVLATFASARQAIEAARACAASGDSAGLPLHLGLHAGDVIREDNNVFGGAVNVAARISGLSAPGEVLVSDVVRTLARTSAGVQFVDRGEQSLKGVGEAVRVWAVRGE
jgi:class 3 adenylate cyclase/pimeloyl-ACP methyl ester carboxylesterase